MLSVVFPDDLQAEAANQRHARKMRRIAIILVAIIVAVIAMSAALAATSGSPHRTVDCAVGYHWAGSSCVPD